MKYNENLSLVGYAIGYMLHVKNHQLDSDDSDYYKSEFAALRHGKYEDFYKLMDVDEKPVIYMGDLTTGSYTDDINDILNNNTFTGLAACGPSLKVFIKDIRNKYNKVIDLEYSDELYTQMGLFELAVRMHLTTKNKIQPNTTLEDCINLLPGICSNPISNSELEVLQNARRFINGIKGHRKNENWKGYIYDFSLAYEILNDSGIKIF